LSTCGSFKLKGADACSFNTWAQSTTEETAVEGDAYTCKKVFAEAANGACPSAMSNQVSDEATCKDAGAALGKKWGGASTWNNIPGGCSSGSAGVYFNLDAGIAKVGFSKLCTSSTPPNGASAPPAQAPNGTTSTTTPSLTCVSSPGVCTKGKWASYLSDTTEVECKAKCEESRRYVPVPDGIQEDVYKFRQNGRFHDVTSKMSSASRKVKNINYRGTGGFWKDPKGKNWPFRDHFYVRWSGYIKIAAAGKYTFNTRSDDGSRLYIDDKKVVDNGGWHGMRDRRANVDLTAGITSFRLSFSKEVAVLAWNGNTKDLTQATGRPLFPKRFFHHLWPAHLSRCSTRSGQILVCAKRTPMMATGVSSTPLAPHLVVIRRYVKIRAFSGLSRAR